LFSKYRKINIKTAWESLLVIGERILIPEAEEPFPTHPDGYDLINKNGILIYSIALNFNFLYFAFPCP
jgi:hypothetical protein